MPDQPPGLVRVVMPVVKATRPADLSVELVEQMTFVVTAACAEVGVKAPPIEVTSHNAYFAPLTQPERAVMEKAKAMVFDRFGVDYEWVERPTSVASSSGEPEVRDA